MTDDRTVVLAITSDQHCGSTVALCPDVVTLDDGQSYGASKPQRWLFQCWRDYWAEVARVRDGEDAKLYAAFNGDLYEGDHHGTSQILNRNPVAQRVVADAVMDVPLALTPDALFFVRGTESHVGTSGASEEGTALSLLKSGKPVQGDPDTGAASWWHLRMEIQGIRLDLAHHGRTGYRSWTAANATLLLAADIALHHLKRGQPHPHLAVRSHFHRRFDSYDAHPVRVVQTGAWQLKTAYVHKVAPESIADVHGLIVVIRRGEMSVRHVQFTPERPAVWTESA